MWVQDEPLLQEELANIISQLIHVVNSSEAQHLFIQTFWQTVNREWQGIDKLRLDKYYMVRWCLPMRTRRVDTQNVLSAEWQRAGVQLGTTALAWHFSFSF